MYKSILLTICVLFSAELLGQSADSTKVDDLFLKWSTPGEPGGAVGVLKDGKLIYAKGFGLADIEHNVAITTTSSFYLASVSKQFTAFCILLLEEEGKLNLDDEIQTFLPDFPKYEGAITISHLIHHTSGLRDFSTLMDLQGKDYLDDVSEKEVYELIKRQKVLNFLPGHEYTYSNSGYYLLGLVIKKITGKTLREFANENIFVPLGMKNTTFLDDNRQIIKNRVFSYEKNSEKNEFSNVIRRYDIVGSGGVYSTIEDLAIWDRNFNNNKLGKGGQEIINKMCQEVKVAKGTNGGYAFGLENGSYSGIRKVSHSGSNASFRSYFGRFPDQRLSIIVLANRSDVNITAKFREVADIFLIDKIKPADSRPIQVITLTDTALSRDDLNNFSGKYFSEELNTLYEIKIQNDKLFLYVNDVEISPLNKVTHNTLSNKEFGTFNFEKNKQINITGFKLNISRVRNLQFSKINVADRKTKNLLT